MKQPKYNGNINYSNIENVDQLKLLYGDFIIEKNTDDSQNQTINEDLDKKHNLQSIKRIVLIGTQFSKSIQKFKEDDIKVDYIDPTFFSYKLKDTSISLRDDKHSVKLSNEDASDTIILMRSGYKDSNLCQALDEIKNLGILILNDVDPVKTNNNKFNTCELLSKYKLPQPKYVLVCSNDCTKEDSTGLEEKIKTIYDKVDDDTKFVCKILHGHGGKGVFLCRKSNIVSICQCIFKLDDNVKLLVQEFKEIQDGDIRVNVITMNGKQEIFDVSMREHTSKDFRTNLSLGNKVNQNVSLSKEQEEMALKAAEISGLTWAGIDLLPSTSGKTYVIEINGAPGPMSDIDDDEAIETNYKFFKKLFDTINKLC